MANFDGKYLHIQKYKVTLDANGDGTKAITYGSSFVGTPNVWVNGHKGDSGTYTATSVTNSGCTISVSSSDIVSQDVEVILIAIEKM